MGAIIVVFVASLFIIVGCDEDKITYSDDDTHPLMNSCFERYETQYLDLGGDVYIADMRTEWAIEDSTYTFNRYLLNNIPGVDLETSALFQSNGFMWFIEGYSNRSFSYVLQQTVSSLWHFDTHDWREKESLRPIRANFVVGVENEIQTSGLVYTVCEANR